MNLSPERFQEMCVQNDAELKMLYAMRCWVRQEIEFRERLKTEWLRASPLRGRAAAADAVEPVVSSIASIPDADDAPELTREWAEKADHYIGGKLIRRGKGGEG